MLQVSGLSYSWGYGDVLKDINVTLGDNEILGIIGKGGSGKTTLLTILAGEQNRYRGNILIDNRELKSLPKKELTRLLYHFNGSVPLNGDETVYNFLGLARGSLKRNLHPLDSLEKNIINSYIDLFELNGLTDHKLKSLSQNYLIMVLLAFAFIREPGIMLLDNPTMFLDIKSTSILHRVLAKTSAQGMGSCVIASSDINFISQSCDRIVVMHNGEIAAEGKPAIINDTMIKKYFDAEVLISKNIYNGRPEIHFFPLN